MEQTELEFISNKGVEFLAHEINARRPTNLSEFLTSPSLYVLLRESNNIYKVLGDRLEFASNFKIECMYYVDGVPG